MNPDYLSIFPGDDADDLHEAIDPCEADQVLTGLQQLIQGVSSKTIKDLLEATLHDLACLMDDEDEADDGDTSEYRDAA